jgi:hypothetical protein
MLHNVRISKPTAADDPSSTSLTPFNFTFPTLADFDAALNYWHARILILRVCWKLNVPSDTSPIRDEGRRAITNILMAWDYGRQQTVFGLIRLLHLSCSLWGAVHDFGVSSKLKEGEARAILLERTNQLYCSIVGETTADGLDKMSAVYAGGPLKGPLLELYQRFWPVAAEVKPG